MSTKNEQEYFREKSKQDNDLIYKQKIQIKKLRRFANKFYGAFEDAVIYDTDLELLEEFDSFLKEMDK